MTWRPFFPSQRQLLCILGAAAGLRVIVVAIGSRRRLESDPLQYFNQAVAIQQGSVHEAFYRPPGTSLAYVPSIAIFGHSHVVGRVMSLVIGVALVGAAMLLAVALMRNRQVTAATGWIMALYPPAILMAGDPQSHVVAALFLCLALASAIKAVDSGAQRYWVGSGVAAGLLTLTRPAAAPLVLLIPLAPWFRFHRCGGNRQPVLVQCALAGLLVLGTMLLVVTPDLIHNSSNGAGVTLASNDSTNLLLGNNRFTPAYWTTDLASHIRSPKARSYLLGVEAEGPASARSEVLDYIRENPLESAVRTSNRARAFWGFDYYASSQWREWGVPAFGVLTVLALEGGGFLLVAGLIAMSLVGPGKVVRSWRINLILAATVVYWIPYVFTFSGGIYHFAVMVILMPLAGPTVVQFRTRGFLTLARQAVHSRELVISLVALVAIQLEYAYWLLRFS